MKRNGLSGCGEVLKVQPDCLICQDSGFIHPIIDGRVVYGQVVRCVCKTESDNRSRQQAMLRYCQLPELTKTLDNFDVSGAKILGEALKSAWQIVNGELIFLTLGSHSNRGKSHLAKGICLEWLKRGVPARYGFVPDLLAELKDGFDLEGEDSHMQRMGRLLDVPLLVLDDLGTEKFTDWGLEVIQRIINHRYEHQLPLVVTTNRAIDELAGTRTAEERMASQRIASRLRREEWSKVLFIEAPSFKRKE